MKIKTITDLEALKSEGWRSLYEPSALKINIGMASCGIAAGANDTYEAAKELFIGDGTIIRKSGCMGFCEQEPLIDIQMPGGPRVVYRKVSDKRLQKIVDAHRYGDFDAKYLLGQMRSAHSLIEGNGAGPPKSVMAETDIPVLEDIPFYRHQYKIALRNCGYMDPDSLEEYIARGGYFSLYKCLTEMDPEQVIEAMKGSGLRGRGGAGFPTGIKWASCRASQGDEKFVICNADEGDPGAYMDRSILEGDPHSIIEGMLICAYAVGARKGFIYVRNEYPLAVVRLKEAIEKAQSVGLLGDHIMGSDLDFNISISKGAGAFVCGESTALMRSLEGKVGRPRAKYIRSVERGYHDSPTTLNNVETLANVPVIIAKGPDWYAGRGTDRSKGTKVFSLVGKVKNTGLVEVPMGTPLQTIISDIGGGILKDRDFKAVQTGGPSGGCIPSTLLDLPVDYDQLSEAGSMMGSGGMIVMDQDTCMVDLARYFLDFLKEESCGQCIPCREGIDRLLEILNDICEGNGKEGDIELLEELSDTVTKLSLCALGGSAPNPVKSTIHYFREEYESHIRDKKCRAGVCKNLFYYEIDPEACTGCHSCFVKCPQGAIVGEKKQAHAIIQDKCIKCSICYETCKHDAVLIK